ncbi:acyl-homoserine lactone synthase [Methylopila capsulata]|uniref:Acyl-homoserine-lactone synthase n=1 Tax=Methylopila capsulata TaxID=61654 RepID=A0A9W6IQC4_9HYPH|nr:acyl-homoserine-lactone synthase [Methylopila capsulata]MBM7851469.1 acyl-homoserine lactone synthase [Methylopila capsulata]GLK54526.1 acyl-homoserine-lactone synthase [Methylopila capsulata]
MIQIYAGCDVDRYQDVFDEVFRFRHEVFVEQMGWEDIRRCDGREIDQFDDAFAVHMVATRNGQLAGYQRMLSMGRPNLLSEIYPDICELELPSGDDVWELTRYAVAPAFREGKRATGSVGTELIAGFVEWGLASGIYKVVIEFEPMWVFRAMGLGFLPRPLGLPSELGDQTIVPTEVTFDQRTLLKIRAAMQQHEPVIQFMGTLAEQRRTAAAS